MITFKAYSDNTGLGLGSSVFAWTSRDSHVKAASLFCGWLTTLAVHRKPKCCCEWAVYVCSNCTLANKIFVFMKVLKFYHNTTLQNYSINMLIYNPIRYCLFCLCCWEMRKVQKNTNRQHSSTSHCRSPLKMERLHTRSKV